MIFFLHRNILLGASFVGITRAGSSWYNSGMESIIRKVRDIDTSERRVLEHVLGQPLRDNQQLIIQVVTLAKDSADQDKQNDVATSGQLPDWCNVYAGLTDEQIAEVEEVILQRSDLTRPSE